MNTEQLKKEFEAWAATIKLENGKQILLKTPAYNAAALLGYQAAAKSRDELIGKLVKAAELSREVLPQTKALPKSESQVGNAVYALEQALAEAKAQGYGE